MEVSGCVRAQYFVVTLIVTLVRDMKILKHARNTTQHARNMTRHDTARHTTHTRHDTHSTTQLQTS
jgi:hypothetical protein